MRFIGTEIWTYNVQYTWESMLAAFKTVFSPWSCFVPDCMKLLLAFF